MNTPLGVQGEAHQKRRDKQEAAFRRTYGADTASTPEAKRSASRAATSRAKFIETAKARIAKANDLLKASGRTPAFA